MLINRIIDFCSAVGADIKAFRDRNITAGNGLTGGGDLSADRTITLGTPGSLTSSTTNSVTSTSHTHDVAIASSTVSGLVELATDAEAITGTDTVRAITPANLRAVNSQALAITAIGGQAYTTPKGNWLSGISFGSFTARKTYAKVNIQLPILAWGISADDTFSVRQQLRNSTGVTTITDGRQITLSTNTGFPVSGVVNVTDVFTGLTVGTTYRVYYQVYLGGGVGGITVNVGGQFLVEP